MCLVQASCRRYYPFRTISSCHGNEWDVTQTTLLAKILDSILTWWFRLSSSQLVSFDAIKANALYFFQWETYTTNETFLGPDHVQGWDIFFFLSFHAPGLYCHLLSPGLQALPQEAPAWPWQGRGPSPSPPVCSDYDFMLEPGGAFQSSNIVMTCLGEGLLVAS